MCLWHGLAQLRHKLRGGDGQSLHDIRWPTLDANREESALSHISRNIDFNSLASAWHSQAFSGGVPHIRSVVRWAISLSARILAAIRVALIGGLIASHFPFGRKSAATISVSVTHKRRGYRKSMMLRRCNPDLSIKFFFVRTAAAGDLALKLVVGLLITSGFRNEG